MSTEPKATLELLLHHLGFPASVEEHPSEDGLLLNVKTEDSGRLIGRGGQVLADLQYLTNRLLFQRNPDAPKVTIDIDGFRAKAQQALVDKALEAAEKVHRWGNVVEMEPMSSFDRRIVHHALKDHPHVTTESVEVEGTNKKVILLRPKTAQA
ncbi:MAG TPA: single-stranded DNA-binding protein [Verrucomicrobiales bacterium]|nr:single-stranded DNA-binding protein [Verrucomicrobiales bacterium]